MPSEGVNVSVRVSMMVIETHCDFSESFLRRLSFVTGGDPFVHILC